MRLYNSKTRKKELFTPLGNKTVKMYVCGITPYDTTHLGHAFTYVFFDVLKRYLEYKEYKVIYTQNVTDIDDDILKKAKEQGKDWMELGKFWTERFLSDMKALNVLKPDYYIKATDSITLMIYIIKVLIEKGYAYEKDGNVYFEVKKFKNYGTLSHYNKKQMILLSKERGGYPDDPRKKDPLDFVLWQKSKEDEPFWESPFGRGRPGWHIECSAMALSTLSEQTISDERSRTIDIHGGGRDLIFPHHESEVAQSESYTNKIPFVKYWLHCGMVLYEGEKMSKSLGNLVMVSDLLKKHQSNEIRFLLLSHHYREPWEFDEIEFSGAKMILSLIHEALKEEPDIKKQIPKNDYLRKFESCMNNDMNTPEALVLVCHLAKRIIHESKISNIKDFQNTLKIIFKTLGFAL
ncbi:MAG: cysteine--tRNA ligase [Candidatus Levybacteria bacterium]|nr:cysteine--tRNA ligase [Candidatus Levybacteria bacterium]